MGTSDGQVIGATKVVDNGPDSIRWNLVVLAEGYQKIELEKFTGDVLSFVAKVKETPPFDAMKGRGLRSS